MSRLSTTFRLIVAFTLAISIGSTMTACSKDKKKGTPVSDRNTNGGNEGTGPVVDPGPEASPNGDQRGNDTDADNKPTQRPATDLNNRGADNRATGVQVSKEGVPAGALAEQQSVKDGDTTLDSLTSTPISDLGVSINDTLVNGEMNYDGGFGFGSIVPSEMESHYQWLRVAVPDYSRAHVRANHRDYPPIITLGTDPAGEFDFTDYNDDLLLNTALQHSLRQVDELSNSTFVQDSKDFAAEIKDIRHEVTPYLSGGSKYSVATVRVTYDYEGVNRTLDLYGIINSNFQATMGQRVAAGSSAPEHKFQGYLTCLDQAGVSYGCQNAILVIEQVKGGKICKRVFAVVRHTNVAATISPEEYRNYYSEPNLQKKAFLQYFGNTILANRINNGVIVPVEGDAEHLFGDGVGGFLHNRYGEIIAAMPMPYMQSITTRTFAVAHGYAETELLMMESNYEKLRSGEMRRPKLRDFRKDIVRVVGPLAKARPGHNVSAIVEVDGYIQDDVEDWVVPWRNEPLYSSLISSAEIVGNDGRGFMEVKFNFNGSSLLVNFMGDNVPVLDPRGKRLYPYQGQAGPSNITFDMMPIPLN